MRAAIQRPNIPSSDYFIKDFGISRDELERSFDRQGEWQQAVRRRLDIVEWLSKIGLQMTAGEAAGNPWLQQRQDFLINFNRFLNKQQFGIPFCREVGRVDEDLALQESARRYIDLVGSMQGLYDQARCVDCPQNILLIEQILHLDRLTVAWGIKLLQEFENRARSRFATSNTQVERRVMVVAAETQTELPAVANQDTRTEPDVEGYFLSEKGEQEVNNEERSRLAKLQQVDRGPDGDNDHFSLSPILSNPSNSIADNDNAPLNIGHSDFSSEEKQRFGPQQWSFAVQGYEGAESIKQLIKTVIQEVGGDNLENARRLERIERLIQEVGNDNSTYWQFMRESAKESTWGKKLDAIQNALVPNPPMVGYSGDSEDAIQLTIKFDSDGPPDDTVLPGGTVPLGVAPSSRRVSVTFTISSFEPTQNLQAANITELPSSSGSEVDLSSAGPSEGESLVNPNEPRGRQGGEFSQYFILSPEKTSALKKFGEKLKISFRPKT